mgnify:CR=1 FL=1
MLDLLLISSNQSVYCLQRRNYYLLLCLFLTSCASPTTQTLTPVLTFNIRYDNPDDGQDAWPNRSTWVANVIDSSGATIVGLQEVLRHQLDDIVQVAPRFSWVGVGRDDGLNAGEFSPLLYDSSVWTVQQWQTRWLSPDSAAVGIAGWDAALPRIATIVDLVHKDTESTLRVINTHFDHLGGEARLQSAMLLSRWAQEVNGPSIIMGDLNFQDGAPPYQHLAGSESSTELVDVAKHFSKTTTPTFRGFDAQNTVGPRIDYVFTSALVTPLSYEVLAPIRGGRFPSDHLPVRVDVRF